MREADLLCSLYMGQGINRLNLDRFHLGEIGALLVFALGKTNLNQHVTLPEEIVCASVLSCVRASS
jgi:hypothetical protein